jgi:hypothetical protein
LEDNPEFEYLRNILYEYEYEYESIRPTCLSFKMFYASHEVLFFFFFFFFIFTEVGRSATCSAMRISATCGTRKFAADVRFNPQAADCGIGLAH